ncbi:hypothetical protein KXX17_007714, partial [Aspergillus fumigatus]
QPSVPGQPSVPEQPSAPEQPSVPGQPTAVSPPPAETALTGSASQFEPAAGLLAGIWVVMLML